MDIESTENFSTFNMHSFYAKKMTDFGFNDLRTLKRSTNPFLSTSENDFTFEATDRLSVITSTPRRRRGTLEKLERQFSSVSQLIYEDDNDNDDDDGNDKESQYHGTVIRAKPLNKITRTHSLSIFRKFNNNND